MRPNCCWTILYLSILAGLLLTLNAESEDSVCSTQIRVRRHTVYKALLGTDIRINCTFAFCNNSNLSISWYKDNDFVFVNVTSRIHIKTELTVVNNSGISFLILNNIQRSDSGLYRCQDRSSVGHSINVFVSGKCDFFTDQLHLDSDMLNSNRVENVWMYVYSAAGIVGFVITVIIISIVSMRECKGKSKEKTHTMEIPMVNQHFPHDGLQLSIRGSPSVPPPSRQSTRKKLPSQPNESTLQRGLVHSMKKSDEKTQSNMVEEEKTSVVYAALNHHLPPGASARPQRQIEESSEYAAIRVS
ncbi:hypothetical protein PAMP_016448 [Pampus punctatissimus]